MLFHLIVQLKEIHYARPQAFRHRQRVHIHYLPSIYSFFGIRKWKFKHALDIAKVDPDTNTLLMNYWEHKDVAKLHTMFNAWNAAMQAATVSRGGSSLA